MLKHIQRKKRSIFIVKGQEDFYNAMFAHALKRGKEFAEMSRKRYVESMLKNISHSSLTHSQEAEYYSEIDKGE